MPSVDAVVGTTSSIRIRNDGSATSSPELPLGAASRGLGFAGPASTGSVADSAAPAPADGSAALASTAGIEFLDGGGAEDLPGLGTKKKMKRTKSEREKRREQARCCREVLKTQKRSDMIKHYSFILCAGVFGFAGGQLIWHGHTLSWWSLPGVGGRGTDGAPVEDGRGDKCRVEDLGDEVVEFGFSSQGKISSCV